MDVDVDVDVVANCAPTLIRRGTDTARTPKRAKMGGGLSPELPARAMTALDASAAALARAWLMMSLRYGHDDDDPGVALVLVAVADALVAAVGVMYAPNRDTDRALRKWYQMGEPKDVSHAIAALTDTDAAFDVVCRLATLAWAVAFAGWYFFNRIQKRRWRALRKAEAEDAGDAPAAAAATTTTTTTGANAPPPPTGEKRRPNRSATRVLLLFAVPVALYIAWPTCGPALVRQDLRALAHCSPSPHGPGDVLVTIVAALVWAKGGASTNANGIEHYLGLRTLSSLITMAAFAMRDFDPVKRVFRPGNEAHQAHVQACVLELAILAVLFYPRYALRRFGPALLWVVLWASMVWSTFVVLQSLPEADAARFPRDLQATGLVFVAGSLIMSGGPSVALVLLFLSVTMKQFTVRAAASAAAA